MGGGPSKGRYKKNGAKRFVSKAKGVEKAEDVRTYEVSDEEGYVRIRVRTYKWSHDGPFSKDDYEPIIYFYEKGENKPKYAIAFSHYGYVYYKNIKSWNSNDYSARFPNEFHTPIQKAEKIKIEDGTLSKGAYACAKAALHLGKQESAEPANETKGLPPKTAEISKEVNKVVKNWEMYRDEFERL